MSRYKAEIRGELRALDSRLRSLEQSIEGFTDYVGFRIPGLREEVALIKAYLQIERCDTPAVKKFCKAAPSRKKGAT